ncbi:MAG: Hint domain-containing protein [Sedimentitalea sp.]
MTATPAAQNILVYGAEMIRVTDGANLGDEISVLDDLMLDDVYQLEPGSAPLRLALTLGDGGALHVAPGSPTGAPGQALHLDCALVLMSPTGQNTEALVLVEVDASHAIAAIYLLPLGPLMARTSYTLVGANAETARRKFAEVACVSFTRGTAITLASGAQIPIEQLSIGDKVLTRDDGAQAVRWVGQTTRRASGDFAPILIEAGTLNNAKDLLVSRNHRLFVYQRRDHLGAGQPELLVKAHHLVNGTSVRVMSGGFIDYFQLLFDRHHIIYAEGIAAESLLIDPRTEPALPADLMAKMAALLPDHSQSHGLEVHRTLLDRPDAVDLLRRASLR